MNIIKTLFVATLAIALPTLMSAQDVMANFVTPDVQLKSSKIAKIVTEVASTKSNSAEMDRYAEASRELYEDYWSSAGLHIYKGVSKPKEFTIILDDEDPRFKYSEPIKRTMITSNFGYRARFHRNHYGIDLKGYTGDTIYAAYAGKIRVCRFDANGFGNYVVIRHANGLETVYGHMTRQLVKIDQEVKSGEPIGLCGNTGRSFGSHLHFEMRFLGEPIDPVKLVDIANHCVQTNTYVFRPGSTSTTSNSTSQKASAPKPEPKVTAQAPAVAEKEKETAQPAVKNNYATNRNQKKEVAATETKKPSQNTTAKAETKSQPKAQAQQKTQSKSTAKVETKKQTTVVAKNTTPQPKTTSYTVKKGESLSAISKKTGVPVAELAKSNNIKGDMIKEGQTLKIKK